MTNSDTRLYAAISFYVFAAVGLTTAGLLLLASV